MKCRDCECFMVCSITKHTVDHETCKIFVGSHSGEICPYRHDGWHDLKKHPDDLPEECERIIFVVDDKTDLDNYMAGFFSIHCDKFINDEITDAWFYEKHRVIAWKYMEEADI